MWTSNTLMKIDTRVYSPSARPSGPRSSGGGGTLAIMVISPSAGATINLSPRGVVRTGSRKKVATQIVAPISSQPKKWLINVYIARAATPAITTYLRPSGWIEGKRHLTVVVEIGVSEVFSGVGMAAPLKSVAGRHNGAVACQVRAS